jgi:hypothetical protein
MMASSHGQLIVLAVHFLTAVHGPRRLITDIQAELSPDTRDATGLTGCNCRGMKLNEGVAFVFVFE